MVEALATRSILVTDDDELLLATLARRGFEVHAAAKRAAACQLASAESRCTIRRRATPSARLTDNEQSLSPA